MRGKHELSIRLTVAAGTIFLALSLMAFPQDERGPDGKYHNPITGEAQPEYCDNGSNNSHPCECSRATACDPKAKAAQNPSIKCKTYCRPNDCNCCPECKK